MNTIKPEATKERLLGEFDAVVDQTEQLLKSVATAGGDHAGALRANVEQSFAAATERLATMRDDALGRANDAATATDEYVQGNPWQAVGIAAAIAAGVGLVVGLLMARR
ncbi:MAG: DUF883 family protein [Usitatibacter sp.]